MVKKASLAFLAYQGVGADVLRAELTPWFLEAPFVWISTFSFTNRGNSPLGAVTVARWALRINPRAQKHSLVKITRIKGVFVRPRVTKFAPFAAAVLCN